MHAYERSCARYPEVIEVLPDPDPFRLAHRAEIYDAARDVLLALQADPRPLLEDRARQRFEDIDTRRAWRGVGAPEVVWWDSVDIWSSHNNLTVMIQTTKQVVSPR